MWRVSLYQGDTSAWVFSSLKMAEKWCEQFGNRFIIEKEKQ